MPVRRGHVLWRRLVAVAVAFVGMAFVGIPIYFALLPALGDIDIEEGLLWCVLACLMLSVLWVFVFVGDRERPWHVLGKRTARRLRKLEGEHLRTTALDSRPKF